jgi:hypothetical protein
MEKLQWTGVGWNKKGILKHFPLIYEGGEVLETISVNQTVED